MVCRRLVSLLGPVVAVGLALGCGADSATAPATAGCSTTPLSLGVGAYASVDPAATSGCVALAANTLSMAEAAKFHPKGKMPFHRDWALESQCYQLHAELVE